MAFLFFHKMFENQTILRNSFISTNVFALFRFQLRFCTYRSPVAQTHPQYIGAWWLGFLVFGIVLALVGIPITMLPWQLPRTEMKRRNREDELHQDRINKEVQKNQDFGKK